MIPFLLFALFFVLFASETLGFDLSLAPGLSVKNAFLYLIFIVLAIETAITRLRKLELLPVFVPFVIYITYAVFSWLIVLVLIDYPGYTLRDSLFGLKGGPIEHLMVLLIFFYGITDKQRAIRVLRSMVWLVIVGNVITVVDALNMPDLGLIAVREDGRVGGTIGNANEFAAFLAFFLPAMVAMYRGENGFRKLLATLGIFVSCLAFLMAVSRGAIVGLAAGGVLGAYYLRRIIAPDSLIRSGAAIVALCVAVVIAGFAVGYGDIVLARFGALGEGAYEASSGRTVIWGIALAKMLDHPITFITGYGWYAYQSAPFGHGTHNYYLNILYDLGIIGVTLFLLVFANALKIARASLNQSAPEVRSWLIAFVIGLLALMIALFFGAMSRAWLYVWAFIGISLRLALVDTGVEPVGVRHRINRAPEAGDKNATSQE